MKHGDPSSALRQEGKSIADAHDKYATVFVSTFYRGDEEDDGWQAPPASMIAGGTPKMWNANDSPAMTFSKDNKKKYGRVWTSHPDDVKLDIADIVKLFKKRKLTEDGKFSCADRLGIPKYVGFGWWRFPVLLTPAEAKLWGPLLDKVNEFWNGSDDDNSRYVLGYHGTKFYCGANVLRNGLIESRDPEEHRLLEGVPGTYFHDLKLRHKCGHYVVYSWFPGREGCYWGMVVECILDRKQRIDRSSMGTDQWVQPKGSFFMTGLRVHGATKATISPSEWGYNVWEPSWEAAPVWPRQHIFAEGIVRQISPVVGKVTSIAAFAPRGVLHSDILQDTADTSASASSSNSVIQPRETRSHWNGAASSSTGGSKESKKDQIQYPEKHKIDDYVLDHANADRRAAGRHARVQGCALCDISVNRLQECIFCANHVCKKHSFWCTMKGCEWKICETCQGAQRRKLVQRGRLWLCPDHLWNQCGSSTSASRSVRQRR